MSTIQLHIVGLPYHEIADCMEDFMDEALGKAVTLRAEHDNHADPQAVVAYDWQGRLIGYVCRRQRGLAHEAFACVERERLRTRIVDVDKRHKSLLVEQFVKNCSDTSAWLPLLDFSAWHYAGPLLERSRELKRLEAVADDIDDLLDAWPQWSDAEHEEFTCMVKQFCALSLLDISREMTLRRQALTRRIEALGVEIDGEVLHSLKRLSCVIGRLLGNKTMTTEGWLAMVADEEATKCLVSQASHSDATKVEALLEAFPAGLYHVWQNDRRHFLSRLYYASVPRHQLWQFLSAIVFVEASKQRTRPVEFPWQWTTQAECIDDETLHAFRRSFEYIRRHGCPQVDALLARVDDEIERRQAQRLLPHAVTVHGNYIEAHDNGQLVVGEKESVNEREKLS